MDPSEAKELRSAGELDEATMAKKRSRRVSFAETTAIHVFDRDEDFETPPDSKPGETLGFHGDHSEDSDDSRGSAPIDADDGEPELFVRHVMDPSSPGGSAVGSLTSNDEDNFFGPVSSSFIRSSLQSDAGMSDDNNHDITLDSTAFSLHFRNVVPSDDRSVNSAGSIRTPTGETVPSVCWGSEVPLGLKKRMPYGKLFDGKASGSAGDSNNMSLIVENPYRFNYGKMSPELEALQAKVYRSMQPNSPNRGSVNSCHLTSDVADVQESGKETSENGIMVASNVWADDAYSKDIVADQIGKADTFHNKQVRLHKDICTTEKIQGTCHIMVKDYCEDDREVTQPNWVAANVQHSSLLSPPYKQSQNNLILQPDNIHLSSFRDEANVSINYSKSLPDSVALAPKLLINYGQQQLESEYEIHTPKNQVPPSQSSLQGSVSSLHVKRKQLFLDLTVLPQSKLMPPSPFGEHAPSSLEMELTRHSERISAIKNHISKFRVPESPLYISSRTAFSGKYSMPIDPEFTISFQSPDKEINKLTDNNGLPSLNLMGSMPLNQSQDSRLHDISHQDLSVRGSFSAQDVDVVGRKRKTRHILCKDDLFSEINSAQKSPKLIPKVISIIPDSSLEHDLVCTNEANNQGGQKTLKNWTDIISKISEVTRQLFSPFYEFNLDELDILGDVLGELHTARKYERLCLSLRNNEHLGHMHQQRIAEARSLHDKLAFERENLQLSRMKLFFLRNKAQLSQSGIRKCNELKSIFVQFCVHGTRASRIHDIHPLSDSTNFNERNQEEHNKVASREEALGMLNQQVKHLVNFFQESSKLKGNMDCDELINVINEHLEMRNRCRFIRQNLQLWELSKIVKKNGQGEVVLNYCNFLLQRFAINPDQVSNIVVNNSLNDANIQKNFPNMDACVAFEFVFKPKDTHKVANSNCFQQETLSTSLLLGTLLDVLEEVQASQIELRNLIYSSFHSHGLDRLELQLCFLDFKSGRKVTMGLDMTYLHQKVYPSNQSDLQFRIISGAQTTVPSSVSNEIRGAVQNLQVERPMILRLCRHISQVLHLSS